MRPRLAAGVLGRCLSISCLTINAALLIQLSSSCAAARPAALSRAQADDHGYDDPTSRRLSALSRTHIAASASSAPRAVSPSRDQAGKHRTKSHPQADEAMQADTAEGTARTEEQQQKARYTQAVRELDIPYRSAVAMTLRSADTDTPMQADDKHDQSAHSLDARERSQNSSHDSPAPASRNELLNAATSGRAHSSRLVLDTSLPEIVDDPTGVILGAASAAVGLISDTYHPAAEIAELQTATQPVQHSASHLQPMLLPAIDQQHQRPQQAKASQVPRELLEDQGSNREGGVQPASPLHATHSSNGSTAQPKQPELPRLVACTLMKNEVPYLVEWIEFHRLVGFAHIAIWDDGSTDNAPLIEQLYRQHSRDYISYDMQPEYQGDMGQFGLANDDATGRARVRRVEAAYSCLQKYRHLADWIIHLDIDEFVWSPRHHDLRAFFQTSVPSDMHLLYAGATRFGWEGMRHRHSYTLEEVPQADGSTKVQLLNPSGLQLLTQSHVHRAPDKRFAEPEELLKDSNENCRKWKAEKGRMSLCMNDADGQWGKTFVRAAYATGLWTHGGSVRSETGSFQADDGTSFASDVFTNVKCPAPACGRSDPTDLHIFHLRSPSLEDDVKKTQDWRWKEHPEQGLQVSDQEYADGTWFFNQIKDVSLLRFSDALSERILPLLSPHADAGIGS